MAAKVILVSKDYDQKEKEYVFEEPAQCVVGRASDCTIRMPMDLAHSFVSRHHCLLDIDPPTVRVRDLGSLNGTYVNGEKIGQRQRHETAEDSDPAGCPELTLHEGDEVQVGTATIRVVIDG
jgi:eukaryotic-like serine/threonine-protein kinase